MSRLYGLVEKRDRFPWKVYRIGCPLFSEVGDSWFLDIYTGGKIMLFSIFYVAFLACERARSHRN